MALTFQTVFLTHAGQPVSDGLAMFRHPKKVFPLATPVRPLLSQSLPQTWRTSLRLLITLANMLRFCWLRNFPYCRLVIFMTLVAIALGLQAA